MDVVEQAFLDEFEKIAAGWGNKPLTGAPLSSLTPEQKLKSLQKYLLPATEKKKAAKTILRLIRLRKGKA